MIRQIDNKELLSYLKERDAVFQSMEYDVKWADEKLSHYNRLRLLITHYHNWKRIFGILPRRWEQEKLLP